MAPVRFRSDWGTRLVRQFSSLWSKRSGTSPRPGTTSVPHPHPPLKRLPTVTGASNYAITSTPFPKGKSGTIGSSLGRHVTASTSTSFASTTAGFGSDGFKSSPVVMLDKKAQPDLYRPISSKDIKMTLNDQHRSKERLQEGGKRSPSLMEGKSMGWWRRNVAGILTWSPDRYPRPQDEKQKERKRPKDHKKEATRADKERHTHHAGHGHARAEEQREQREYADAAWQSDAEFDPLATSRTFDSCPADDLDGAQTNTTGLSPVDSTGDIIHPPVTRHSEEALGMYKMSPSSSTGGTSFFTAARRASSWGQGDKAEYEVQSITSDVAPQDGIMETNEQYMLRGSEGMYTVDRGVFVQVSSQGEHLETLFGGMGDNHEDHSPGPSSRNRGGNVHSNVQRLTPILDSGSSNHHSSYEQSLSVRSKRSRRRSRRNTHTQDGDEDWSEDDDDEDDDASSDHALTFSPSRRAVSYDDDQIEEALI